MEREKKKRDYSYRNQPVNPTLGCPPIPDQGGRIEKSAKPRILPHPVFGTVNELALFIVPIGLLGLALHDVVHPSAPEQAGEDVSERTGKVQQTDYEGGVAVGGFSKGLLD